MVAATPTVLAVLTAAAIVEPFVRVTIGLSNTQTRQAEMLRREKVTLVGTWRPVSRRTGLRAVPVDDRERLVIRDGLGFRWVRDGVVSEGNVRVHFHQNPSGVTMFGYGNEGWYGDRTGLYKWDGDRLTIALGRIDAIGPELPTGFADDRPDIEVVIFERVPEPPIKDGPN